MRGPAPILVLDDGDLLRVRNAIDEIGVDFEHCGWNELRRGMLRPSQLLVTSPRYATEIASLRQPEDGPVDPIWVCAHAQDFLPFRERLRSLGVHYLISSTLQPEAMRLFFLQLLYGEQERRHNERVLVSCELAYWLGDKWGSGRLQELSRAGCRLLANEPAVPGASAVVRLPGYVGGSELTLTGCVTHCAPEEERSGGDGLSLIVLFEALEPKASAQLKAIIDGRNIGTRITPLWPPPPRPADAPERPPEKAKPRKRAAARKSAKSATPRRPRKVAPAPREPSAPERPRRERRAEPRREYQRRLMTLNADAERAVLGRDLSMTGVRLERHPGLAVGATISLAIYGGPREEPLILDAEVVWKDPAGGVGLRFDPMTKDERRWLEQLLEQLPLVESLSGIQPEGERIVVSKVLRAGE